jgi:hypothetical protein
MSLTPFPSLACHAQKPLPQQFLSLEARTPLSLVGKIQPPHFRFRCGDVGFSYSLRGKGEAMLTSTQKGWLVQSDYQRITIASLASPELLFSLQCLQRIGKKYLRAGFPSDPSFLLSFTTFSATHRQPTISPDNPYNFIQVFITLLLLNITFTHTLIHHFRTELT